MCGWATEADSPPLYFRRGPRQKVAMQFRGGMNELVRQAARMQRKIDQVKEEIKDREVIASAAGDKVTVTATCEGKSNAFRSTAISCRPKAWR